MSSIISASKLIFFKSEKYQYNLTHTFDVSNCPRPHYCLGLITDGCGTFTDCMNGEQILVSRGDIIFVPMGSRYISNWKGSPAVCYISMHFVFDSPGIFCRENNYKLQKITPASYENCLSIFEYVLHHFNGSSHEKLQVLSNFYSILSEILPKLKCQSNTSIDPKIKAATQYIQDNYKTQITVENLATVVQMSVSRFYPLFRNELGITPIDYINNYRISQAIISLMNDDRSIEQIAEDSGFESSAYFRRVFKKVTGLSPRAYKKISMEL